MRFIIIIMLRMEDYIKINKEKKLIQTREPNVGKVVEKNVAKRNKTSFLCNLTNPILILSKIVWLILLLFLVS